MNGEYQGCYTVTPKTDSFVTDDGYMIEQDKLYPAYGFAKNKGYGTKAHYEGIRAQGMCPIHRRSFLKNFEEKHR